MYKLIYFRIIREFRNYLLHLWKLRPLNAFKILMWHCKKKKISPIWSQFLSNELVLVSSRTCTNFVTMDQFLLEFKSKEMFTQTDRQTNIKLLHGNTINNSITRKSRISQNNKNHKIMDIGTLIQRSGWTKIHKSF